MSIESEITRLQGVKSDILQAISDKGVVVPVGSALDDCPSLISQISGSDPGILYKTDFSNYDYANNIDYPEIGTPTQFTSNSLSDFSISQSTLAYGDTNSVNALSVGMVNVNVSARLNFTLDIRNTKKVEFELVALIKNDTTSMPTFLWFDVSIGLADDITYSPSKRVLVSNSYSKTNLNVDNTLTSAGYSWLSNETFCKYASNYKMICDFENNTMRIIHNNIPVVDVTSVPFVNNNLTFELSPRYTVNNIKIASIIARAIN